MSITIGGFVYNSGSIKVINDKVWINGKRVDAKPDKNGILKIEVTGTLSSLEADGSVICEDVAGDVDAGGSVQAGDVGGDVDAGGSVQCGKVSGDVDAGGSVVVM